MATTPPPPSFLRIPPTPRHGTGYDQYEPYSTRHSARLASQRALTESRTTPPPSFPLSQGRGTSRSTKKTAETETLSPPGSPMSPRKKMSGRNVTTQLDDSDSFDTAKPAHSHPSRLFRPTITEGMLPTPAKTPRKKPVDNAGSTARVLFPSQSGQKKKKKQTGFSLDSFTDDPSQGDSIQIYTDSRDRVPEVDESEENPFYQKQKPSTNTNTRPSRRKTTSRDQEVDKALKREDGMVYVFRGKKMFRKFSDDAGSDEECDDDDLGLLASRPDLLDSAILENSRPLTRSSVKPRVLFPSAHDRAAQEHDDTDEEAATDIEDHVLDDTDVTEELDPNADIHSQQERPVTPPANSAIATPPSPGASVRSLRPRAKRELEIEQTPIAPDAKKKKNSPFDGWLRKKKTPPVAASKTKKRDAETAGSPSGPAPKKTRGNRASASS
ncbi:hypothetical protein BJX76DRAFT_338573 [Aspergillus varians]